MIILKKRRAQITLFLLVGLVLLLVVVFVFSLIYSIAKDNVKINQEVLLNIDSNAQAMKSLVEQCIEDVGESALITFGYRGGRASIETPHFKNYTIPINYDYYLGKSKVPSLDDMENSLEKLMNNNLANCVNVSLEEKDGIYLFQGALIELGVMDTNTKITETSVIFTINWPITLNIDGAEKELADFTPIEIPIRLKKMSSVIDNLVWQLTINPYFIDAFYLLDQGLSFDIAIFDADTYVFIVTDNETTINYEPYKFIFAAKIKTPEEE